MTSVVTVVLGDLEQQIAKTNRARRSTGRLWKKNDEEKTLRRGVTKTELNLPRILWRMRCGAEHTAGFVSTGMLDPDRRFKQSTSFHPCGKNRSLGDGHRPHTTKKSAVASSATCPLALCKRQDKTNQTNQTKTQQHQAARGVSFPPHLSGCQQLPGRASRNSMSCRVLRSRDVVMKLTGTSKTRTEHSVGSRPPAGPGSRGFPAARNGAPNVGIHSSW